MNGGGGGGGGQNNRRERKLFHIYAVVALNVFLDHY